MIIGGYHLSPVHLAALVDLMLAGLRVPPRLEGTQVKALEVRK